MTSFHSVYVIKLTVPEYVYGYGIALVAVIIFNVISLAPPRSDRIRLDNRVEQTIAIRPKIVTKYSYNYLAKNVLKLH